MSARSGDAGLCDDGVWCASDDGVGGGDTGNAQCPWLLSATVVCHDSDDSDLLVWLLSSSNVAESTESVAGWLVCSLLPSVGCNAGED